MGTAGLYVLELATGALEPLAGVPADSSALGAAVSPDGTRIAFDAEVDGSRQVWVMNADGTDLERVTDEIEAIEPTWSPDGRSLAYAGMAKNGIRTLIVVDLASGETRRVIAERSDVFGANWSPDGDSIVYQVQHGEGWRLRSVDVRSGRAVNLCCDRRDSLASDADWSPDGKLLVFGYATPEDNFALHTITPSGSDVTQVSPLTPPGITDIRCGLPTVRRSRTKGLRASGCWTSRHMPIGCWTPRCGDPCGSTTTR
jgi:Tol biopolymer transport system component